MIVTKYRAKIPYYIFGICIFLFSFVFFTQINPIVIFDTDDWVYASYSRVALPTWGSWNPARILPEILMGLSSRLGLMIVYPFTNDYINSLSIAYGLVLSVCISIYIYRFMMFVNTRFARSKIVVFSISILFFLYHFWAFKRMNANNDYFFRSYDATCYFFYTIPNLLNASLVLLFLEKKLYSFSDIQSKIKISIIVVFIYFSAFSNLYSSIIMAVFFSFIVLRQLIINRKKESIVKQIKNVSIPVLGLVLLMIAALFEWQGGRAQSGDMNGTFDIKGTVLCFISSIKHNISLSFIAFIGIVVIISVIVFVIGKEKSTYKEYIRFLLMGVYCVLITLLCLVLLSAKVKSSHMERTDVLFCVFFYGFLLLSVLLCSFAEKNLIKVVLPLILIIVFSMCFSSGQRAFLESNYLQIESDKCEQLDKFMIEQLQEAESKGITEVSLRIPCFDTNDDPVLNNWPIQKSAVQSIANTLYKHHIINSKMTVSYYLDEEVNIKFGLDTTIDN